MTRDARSRDAITLEPVAPGHRGAVPPDPRSMRPTRAIRTSHPTAPNRTSRTVERSGRSDRSGRSGRTRVAAGVLASVLALAGSLGVDAWRDRADAVTHASVTATNPSAVRIDFVRRSDGQEEARCSGLVISRHWILTSAHCLRGRSINTYNVRVVRTNAAGTNDTLYPVGAASFSNHPDYDERFGTIDRGNDIGLVRLYDNGLSSATPARIYDGFIKGDGWKGRHDRFGVHGYGQSNVAGSNDCSASVSGVKRFGWFDLGGSTVDAGWLGTGDPQAVSAPDGTSRLCHGDSGAPWGFDGPLGSLAFALQSGPGARLHGVLGGSDQWATLIRPKVGWMTDTSRAKGLPLTCYQYTQFALVYVSCAEPTPPPPPRENGPLVGTVSAAPGRTPAAPGPVVSGTIGQVAVDEPPATGEPMEAAARRDDPASTGVAGAGRSDGAGSVRGVATPAR